MTPGAGDTCASSFFFKSNDVAAYWRAVRTFGGKPCG